MKKFDLSSIAVKEIKDVYSYTVPKGVEGKSKLDSNALIIKRSGKTVYDVDGKKFTADANNILFMPAGVEYSMEVEESGACFVIEFDICNSSNSISCCEFFFNNSRDILTTAKNILHYWSLKGPAFETQNKQEPPYPIEHKQKYTFLVESNDLLADPTKNHLGMSIRTIEELEEFFSYTK